MGSNCSRCLDTEFTVSDLKLTRNKIRATNRRIAYILMSLDCNTNTTAAIKHYYSKETKKFAQLFLCLDDCFCNYQLQPYIPQSSYTNVISIIFEYLKCSQCKSDLICNDCCICNRFYCNNDHCIQACTHYNECEHKICGKCSVLWITDSTDIYCKSHVSIIFLKMANFIQSLAPDIKQYIWHHSCSMECKHIPSLIDDEKNVESFHSSSTSVLVKNETSNIKDIKYLLGNILIIYSKYLDVNSVPIKMKTISHYTGYCATWILYFHGPISKEKFENEGSYFSNMIAKYCHAPKICLKSEKR